MTPPPGPSRLPGCGGERPRSGLTILVDAAFSVLLFVGTIVGVIALATLIWTILDDGSVPPHGRPGAPS